MYRELICNFLAYRIKLNLAFEFFITVACTKSAAYMHKP